VVVDEDEPGARAPAPGALRTLQLFVNTHDREGEHDLFETPDAVAGWLRVHGLGDLRVSASDRLRLVALREALRGSLLGNNGRPDEQAVAHLDAELGASRATLHVAPTGLELRPSTHGVDSAVGTLLSIMFDAMLDGTWVRLKACRRDVCEWVFYDHSRNRSGTWCTMSICGNRTKTSAYWRRHHASESA
jgi:predicted RNA-binding Zn ribbon-like protein